MKYISILLLIFAMAALAEMSVCGTEELLPIGFTDEELLRLDEIGCNTVATSPPPDGTENPGEYAPATGVFIRWPMGLPDDLIVSFSQVTTVWVICTEGQQSSAETHFTNVGVNMDNVDFIFAPTNSVWVRDYGPWFVLLPDGSQGIFNYTYNRVRPDDNNFPAVAGSTWDIPVYTSTIVHTGGNYMSSGFDQAMSTNLVYSENSGNEDWVDTQMDLYLGIDNYVVMEDPQSSYIHHIDCWAKMLSPDRILVLQVPPSHPDYTALEAAADLLALTPSPYGTLWNVYRVQSSGSEGYTNSLISNDHVYLPLFSSSYDAAAIALYQEALPGYTVEGFPYGGWAPTDALHCRTRNVMDNEMLLVQHIPVDSLQTAGSPVTINALIRCHPDNALLDHDLNYRIGTSGVFTTLSMSSGSADSFSVNIPGVPDGETVQYYISASDNSGRNEAQPRFAPATWFFEYETSTTGIGGGETPAGIFALNRVSPNPFSGSLSLEYSAASPAVVVLSVYDITGRMIERRTQDIDAGTGSLIWNAGEEIPEGIYFISLVCGDTAVTKMVTLIK